MIKSAIKAAKVAAAGVVAVEAARVTSVVAVNTAKATGEAIEWVKAKAKERRESA